MVFFKELHKTNKTCQGALSIVPLYVKGRQQLSEDCEMVRTDKFVILSSMKKGYLVAVPP